MRVLLRIQSAISSKILPLAKVKSTFEAIYQLKTVLRGVYYVICPSIDHHDGILSYLNQCPFSAEIGHSLCSGTQV